MRLGGTQWGTAGAEAAAGPDGGPAGASAASAAAAAGGEAVPTTEAVARAVLDWMNQTLTLKYCAKL